MTLAFVILNVAMLSVSLPLFALNIVLPRLLIGQKHDTLASLFHGIMTITLSTFPCLDTFHVHYIARFQHPHHPAWPQHAPHAWTPPIYGASQQFVVSDVTPVLDLSDKRRVQKVLGTLLFYAWATDSTMLPAIGTLATQQAGYLCSLPNS